MSSPIDESSHKTLRQYCLHKNIVRAKQISQVIFIYLCTYTYMHNNTHQRKTAINLSVELHRRGWREDRKGQSNAK